MLREWWRPIYQTWFCAFVPFAALLLLGLYSAPGIAALALWWLKPLFDRPVLHVLSRAVFGAAPGVRQTFAAWRDWIKPGLVASLTLGRIDSMRSFLLPVWQLEKNTGRGARARRKILYRGSQGPAGNLIGACSAFEIVFMLALLVLPGFLAPGSGLADFDLLASITGDGDPDGVSFRITLAYAVAMSLVEPLYVACGFGLYINRRVLLEGWDIEVSLRRMDGKVHRAHAPGSALAAALFLALALGLATEPLHAEERAPGEVVAEVLKQQEFQRTRETGRWQLKSRGEDVEPRRETKPGFDSHAFRDFGNWLGSAVQVLAWILVVVLLVAGLVLGRRYFAGIPARVAGSSVAPASALFGAELTLESLPADIVGAARDAGRAGRIREALSLLYRGAIASLVFRHQVEFAGGDTERDCLRRVRDALAPEAVDYFAKLLTAWQQAAYAARLPEPPELEHLFGSWNVHFGETATARDGAEHP